MLGGLFQVCREQQDVPLVLAATLPCALAGGYGRGCSFLTGPVADPEPLW